MGRDRSLTSSQEKLNNDGYLIGVDCHFKLEVEAFVLYIIGNTIL